MDPKSKKKLIFEIFGYSGRNCFFKVFGDKKNLPQNRTKIEKKQRGSTGTCKIGRPGGMRGASGEVRRG